MRRAGALVGLGASLGTGRGLAGIKRAERALQRHPAGKRWRFSILNSAKNLMQAFNDINQTRAIIFLKYL